MRWLRDHGLIAKLSDYEELPLQVLEDCRLLMEAEAMVAEKTQREAAGARRR